MRSTIVLSGNPREKGMKAAEGLKPGQIVEYDASAGDSVVTHIAAGGAVAPLMVVREQHENNGHGILDAVLDEDSVVLVFPQAGDEVLLWTTDTIGIGDKLASDGAGGVKIATSGNAVIGVASGPTEFIDSEMFVPAIIGAFQAE